MRHSIDFKIMVAFVLLCLFASCNEDKGNYDYAEIDKVTEIKDIQESYVVELGEQFRITPKLETALGNLDDFEYTWYYEARSKVWNVLQEGKNLDFIIDAPLGTPDKTYNCAFEAKNKQTEATYRQLFTVRVSSSFTRGFVMLCEQEDGFDMSMVVLTSQNHFVSQYNLLGNTAPELKRDGVKPYEIRIFDDSTAPNPYYTDGSKRSVYLLTDQYTTRLKTGNFSWDPSYEISNFVEKGSPLYNDYVALGKPIIAEKMEVGFFSNTGSYHPHTYIYMKNDAGQGNWYIYNVFPALYFFSYPMNGVRVSGNESKRYEPAPFLGCSSTSTTFFNTEENRFYVQFFDAIGNDRSSKFFYTQSLLDTSSDGIFNFNEPNTGLFYMSERRNTLYSHNLFAFLKQENGTFKYIEFKGAASVASMIGSANKVRTCIFDASTGIGKAKFISAPPSPYDVYLYYVTEDNKVYYADLSGSNAVVREITSAVIPEGYDEVTAFRFGAPSTLTTEGDALYRSIGIATYNSTLGKDKGGRMDFYTVSSVSSGELKKAFYDVKEGEKEEMSWTGLGRIVSFDYKP